jgi:hypothetical protein
MGEYQERQQITSFSEIDRAMGPIQCCVLGPLNSELWCFVGSGSRGSRVWEEGACACVRVGHRVRRWRGKLLYNGACLLAKDALGGHAGASTTW